MLRTHSKRHHEGRSVLSTENHASIVERLSLACYRLSGSEKYDQPPGGKPVDGLEVLTGFSCPVENGDGSQCPLAFRAEATFVRHLSTHRVLPKPQPSSCVSHIQTLFDQGGHQRYFSVNPSLSNLDPSSSSAYVYAVSILGKLPKADIPMANHDKDRASIHWFTRWPELLQPYITDRDSQAFLQSLVSFPVSKTHPAWLTKLQDHGRRWWDAAELAHINCSYRASVMIRSHEQ